ncbi:hypothetical protein PC116_g25579 [Phytophthora cactorum]|uniref:Uncharacterized protein n=1 Tax=Phytophthora cactorum TaxID=29920 RepID=A0A8T1JQC4_9STRA|nr:hypothetical protein PC114_g23708 [Phytophthora cactorum]KAG2894361.1 hypothetical protein PC117_g23506 [Phytophthora cactorum]KAG2972216.1 hypothetical protein PC119_g23227 [Phytophthora cactorum]KAG2990494.1 hypothetical protein PC120_g22933 [Phytophthora cactorum]KAG3129830.1 hypothetical protein C6341_g23988 [Phytophthora cactorum]
MRFTQNAAALLQSAVATVPTTIAAVEFQKDALSAWKLHRGPRPPPPPFRVLLSVRYWRAWRPA